MTPETRLQTLGDLLVRAELPVEIRGLTAEEAWPDRAILVGWATSLALASRSARPSLLAPFEDAGRGVALPFAILPLAFQEALLGADGALLYHVPIEWPSYQLPAPITDRAQTTWRLEEWPVAALTRYLLTDWARAHVWEEAAFPTTILTDADDWQRLMRGGEATGALAVYEGAFALGTMSYAFGLLRFARPEARVRVLVGGHAPGASRLPAVPARPWYDWSGDGLLARTDPTYIETDRDLELSRERVVRAKAMASFGRMHEADFHFRMANGMQVRGPSATAHVDACLASRLASISGSGWSGPQDPATFRPLHPSLDEQARWSPPRTAAKPRMHLSLVRRVMSRIPAWGCFPAERADRARIVLDATVSLRRLEAHPLRPWLPEVDAAIAEARGHMRSNRFPSVTEAQRLVRSQPAFRISAEHAQMFREFEGDAGPVGAALWAQR